MKCLYCNQAIEETNNSLWHKKCVKKFFGCDKLPEINFTALDEEINKLGNEIISNNRNITGVQKKLSLHLSKENGIDRLTIVGYPSGYILKPESDKYKEIARAEYLVMKIAEELGIRTVENGLLYLGNTKYAYITKRIDRKENSKIHMEDFCQLSNKLTENKYLGSYEKCGKILDQYSLSPQIDKTELFKIVLFSFIIGNSDMHLKNFSLFENDLMRLAPAYDLLPVQILINDDEELALTLNGKKRNITKNDFLTFSNNLGINKTAVAKMINQIIHKKELIINAIDESLLCKDSKERLEEIVNERINRLM